MSNQEIYGQNPGSISTELPEDDKIINYINERCKDMDRGYLAIGKYILERYFANEPANFQDRNPFKNTSLRSLAKRRNKILLSLSMLSKILRVVIQDTQLREHSVDVDLLSFTAKAELLSHQDEQGKVQLSHKILAEGLSTREVRELVKIACKKKTGNATEPSPFSKFLKTLKGFDAKVYLPPESLAETDPSLRTQLREEVLEGLRLLNQHLAACNAALETLEG